MSDLRPQTDPLWRRAARSHYILSVCYPLVLWACYFPLNLGWLGWVALLPFLRLIQLSGTRRTYLSTWLGGFLFGLIALQWVRLASAPMYFTWIALALFIALHFLVAAFLIRRLTMKAGLPFALVAPCVWTTLEYVRAHIGIGFPWYYMGHTQHDFLPIIQIADLVGAYGVSFLVVLVNTTVYGLVVSIVKEGRNEKSCEHRAAPAISVILILTSLAYGFYRINEIEFTPGPRLALIQSNLPQDIRNDPDQTESSTEHYRRLGDQAIREKPDLMVWPETSFPFYWMRLGSDVSSDNLTEGQKEWLKFHEESAQFAKKVIAKRWPAYVLMGLNSEILERSGKSPMYNSALLLNPNGTELGRYDKIYRIPFGEYIPWVQILPIMARLSPYEGDYGIKSGESYTRFSLPVGERAFQFSVLICYEDTVPHLPKRFLDEKGSPPDFFINISNDGWFKGSEEHEQHLVGARFRAVESRRSLARAVNMGVSAVIDPNGRIIALPGNSWYSSKNVDAVVMGTVPIDSRWSFYLQYGDVLAWMCVGVSLIGLLVSFIRRKA